MGFTHHKGISVSNLIASSGTIATLKGTTFKASTKVSTATVNATSKVSSPTINATTNFNLKSIIVKANKGVATYGTAASGLSDGSGFVPTAGDTILRAFQWRFSSATLKSASAITATTKLKATGILSFAAPLLTNSVVLVDFLDKT